MSNSLEQSRLEQFSPLEFLARQVVEGFITGLHKSPFHGFSVEFAEHRLYNPGESIRSIDWKLFGRTDRLYTKRYEEETNLRCQVFIDNSSSMYYPVLAHPDIDHPNKITFSVYVAAALIYLFRKQRDAAGISVFSDSVELHTQTKSNTVHHRYLFSELEKLLLAHTKIGSEELAALAQARAEAVIAALTDAGGIPRERVFLAATDMTAPPATAGVSRSRVEFGMALK